MGRKAKYRIEDLPTNYLEIIYTMMKDEGASIKEVCAELEITASAYATMRKTDIEFARAFDEGVQFAEAWWMKQGRRNLENKGFNVGIYAFQMKNRYKWRDTPLIVQGNDKGKLDSYKKESILKDFEKKEDKKNEEIIN